MNPNWSQGDIPINSKRLHYTRTGEATGECADDIRPQWHPRVKKELVRRLYENDARGLRDEDLIARVGFALLLRCQSILIATEAHAGRATCPRCEAIIPHHSQPDEALVCARCGWQTTWAAYHRSYRDRQLFGGGAVDAFRNYAEIYPQARAARERMLLIDQLLHAFHTQLTRDTSRPAACNLIAGKSSDILVFLDRLTFGEGSAPELQQAHAAWQATAMESDWMRNVLRESRRRRAGREGD
ncbi:MAG: hypothetical protein M1434_06945 [Chloroflexi bacterium]|nr:hypothetical protein [Chloroflexota bacterium]MCL5274467.1 hypothetical protein [Chloroflexota bacterium]